MIAVIRIKGMTGIRADKQETLNRLRLRRKFVCVLLRDTKENMIFLKKIESFVAYGKLNHETLTELIKIRGKSINGSKINVEETVKTLLDHKIEKNLEDLGIKPFFRLHPPRGGFNSKEHFPRGILGDNKEKINELVRRML